MSSQGTVEIAHWLTSITLIYMTRSVKNLAFRLASHCCFCRFSSAGSHLRPWSPGRDTRNRLSFLRGKSRQRRLDQRPITKLIGIRYWILKKHCAASRGVTSHGKAGSSGHGPQATLCLIRDSARGSRLKYPQHPGHCSRPADLNSFYETIFRQKGGFMTMRRRWPTCTRVDNLPPEILLLILLHLPDIESLINASLTHRSFHRVVAGYKDSLSTSILRNKLGHETFIHAVVSYIIVHTSRAAHAFQTSQLSAPELGLQLVYDARKAAEMQALPARMMARISRRHTKITELCEVLVGASSPMTNFPAFQGFGSSHTEQVRVHRALYIYDILARLCGILHDGSLLPGAIKDFSFQDLHNRLLSKLLAPWETQQIIAIRWYLGRTLLGSCTYGNRG